MYETWTRPKSPSVAGRSIQPRTKKNPGRFENGSNSQNGPFANGTDGDDELSRSQIHKEFVTKKDIEFCPTNQNDNHK